MFPWDFGIINALNKESKFKIIPNNSQNNVIEEPCLLFELKNILQCKNFTAKADFSLTVIENDGNSMDMLKDVNKIICKDLDLYQSSCKIGTAKIKVNSIENKKNLLTLNLSAILNLKAIYEDENE